MKPRILLIIIVLMALLFSCGKHESCPTCPDNTAQPILNINKTSLDFGDCIQGEILNQTFSMSNEGTGYFEWLASADQTWITLNPANGAVATSDITVTVTIDTSPLGLGSHTGNVTITSSTEGVQGSPKSITVSVNTTTINVPGHELSENEVWSGTLILKGDIKIPSGVTLTIEPGTIIKVATANLDWDGGFVAGEVDIYSRGNIIANGTKDNIIVFTVDSNTPTMDDWWGIGLSGGSSASLKYCCIAYADYGLFVFSTYSSTPIVENCMFAYSGGIVDFGPNSNISHNTFINGDYGYSRWEDYRTASISNCVFENNSMIDVEALDSYNNVTIGYSNFINNGWYNLYISDTFNPTNVIIAASDCYGITRTNDNGCGTITINSPSDTPLPNAGCGFELSELPLKASRPRSIKPALKGIIDDEQLMKSYNEKDKNHVW